MNASRGAIIVAFVAAVAISGSLQYWIKEDYFRSFVAGLVFTVSVLVAALGHFKPALSKSLGGRIVASIATGFLVVALYAIIGGIGQTLWSHWTPYWLNGFLDGAVSAGIVGLGVPAAVFLFDKALLEENESAVSLGN